MSKFDALIAVLVFDGSFSVFAPILLKFTMPVVLSSLNWTEIAWNMASFGLGAAGPFGYVISIIFWAVQIVAAVLIVSAVAG